jgi:hypothetical protein
MMHVRYVHFAAGAFALAAGCAASPTVEHIVGGGLSVDAGKPRLLVRGTPEHEWLLAHDQDPAAVTINFVRKDGEPGRKVQALAGSFYEVRATYTEAIVRSAATLADYHVGVKALANSLTGFSLNVPPPGAKLASGSTGVPRLRYAQHTVSDDPLFPSLVDGTKTLNPTSDGNIYFLGQGILKTAQVNGSPPTVNDAFAAGVSSVALGSASDEQSIKLSLSAAEALFNTVWNTGVYYTDPSTASAILGPVTQDRPLTDNTNLTITRYYKWKFPFTATSFTLGSNLPLGRLIMDIRVVSAQGAVLHSGSTQYLLQNGNNAMTVSVAADLQGLSDINITLPK